MCVPNHALVRRRKSAVSSPYGPLRLRIDIGYSGAGGGLRLHHVSVSAFHIISFYSPSMFPITCQTRDDVDSNSSVVGADEGTDNGHWLLRVRGFCVGEAWLRMMRG